MLPMLPELQDSAHKEPNALAKEFSSEDTVIDFDKTVALLKKHQLMVEDVDLTQGEELLR